MSKTGYNSLYIRGVPITDTCETAIETTESLYKRFAARYLFYGIGKGIGQQGVCKAIFDSGRAA